MPKGMKPSPNFKGNKNSGDKPDSVKFAQFINTNLANEIGNEELKEIKATPVKKRNHFRIKDIVMPVVLKNMTQKSESDVNIKLPQPILNVLNNQRDKENSEPDKTD